MAHFSGSINRRNPDESKPSPFPGVVWAWVDGRFIAPGFVKVYRARMWAPSQLDKGQA